MDTHSGVPRILATTDASPVDGTVRWAPVNSMWLGSMTLVALVFGPQTLAWDTAALFFISCGVTLCLGHSLGIHRRLVHNSYDCPLWLEYVFVYCGTLVGMAGPMTMVRTHDTRHWAQRQPQCHDYFAHRRGHQTYLVDDAGVQGHNIGLGGLGGLVTMGECWHNNHHAFPGSARLGLHAGQHDVGWWVLRVLHKIGWVWDLRLPSNLPLRSQVRVIDPNSNNKATYELSTSPRH